MSTLHGQPPTPNSPRAGHADDAWYLWTLKVHGLIPHECRNDTQCGTAALQPGLTTEYANLEFGRYRSAVCKKRRSTALPNEPVPPVIKRVLSENIGVFLVNTLFIFHRPHGNAFSKSLLVNSPLNSTLSGGNVDAILRQR